MKEKTVKTVNEETVTVIPSKLKVWDRYELEEDTWKHSKVLESDTCRTKIPLNPDGSVKWFDDSKLIRHDWVADLPDRICDCISDGYDDEEYREEATTALYNELSQINNNSNIKAAFVRLCERIEELEA